MSESSRDRNFLTQGPIWKVILVISAPLMLNNLVRTFYTVADGLYLAQLSAEDFAASAFSWPLNFLFISLGMGIGVAATALLSNFIGSKQFEKLERYVDTTLLLTVGLGLILSFIGYYLTPWMLSLMGGEGNFLKKSIIYFEISFVGLVFDFAFFSYQALLNAQGKTKVMTFISIISMLINIILDPIFIYEQVPLIGIPGLGWGIAGAAWATVISKVALLIFAIFAVRTQSMIQPKLFRAKTDLPTAQHLMKLALPSFLGYGGSSLGFTVMNALITSYGTNTLAAFSMVNRISDIVMQPQMGVGMALTSIIGQNMGAKQNQRVHQIFNRAIVFILVMSIVASGILLAFQQPILSIFIKEGAGADLWFQAKEYLAYTAFIIFFMGLFAALNGFFQGCGQTKYSMYMTIGRLWVIRVPVVMFLRYFTNLGSTGIWISMLISNLLIVVWGYYIYRSKDWKSLALAQIQKF